MEEIGVLHQLHKLSSIESEETLDHMLSTIWSTTKTGLSLSDKSHFQSLLNLSSTSHVDPVLACLRSLLRKCVHQNPARDEVLKLFPSDLPLHLQTNLLSSLQRNRDRWKEEISPQLKGTPNFTPSQLWPRQERDSFAAGFDTVAAVVPQVGASGITPPCFFQCDAVAASDNLENLPCLKSMTWTMENRGSSPADRVAIISLKLHDYNKSPSGETEVKFQLTRDTLEAMLRSMTYIREQLNAVETSSGPANKKQKH